MNDQTLLLRLAIAAIGGLAVGIEREWSARQEQDPSRFGGVRTFLLLGLLGGLSAALVPLSLPLALLILALVVLPLLPAGPYGPGPGIEPRTLPIRTIRSGSVRRSR